jgi:diketogulonate reductase-like aldo/keto reductase
MYHNEKESGKAVTDYLASDANTQGLKREDIHFTSKLASNGSYDAARKAIKQSVNECGLGYIDLFLLHSPYGGKKARLDSWRAVEDAIEVGEVRIGGVSNYGVKHASVPQVPSPLPCFSQTCVHVCQQATEAAPSIRLYTRPQTVANPPNMTCHRAKKISC